MFFARWPMGSSRAGVRRHFYKEYAGVGGVCRARCPEPTEDYYAKDLDDMHDDDPFDGFQCCACTADEFDAGYRGVHTNHCLDEPGERTNKHVARAAGQLILRRKIGHLVD